MLNRGTVGVLCQPPDERKEARLDLANDSPVTYIVCPLG